MSVKGYKVFNPDWTCKGKQYTCPGTFEEDVNPSVCNVGMRFCKNAADCFNYYDFDPNNHVAEVIAHGTVAEGKDKCATNKLEIAREIPWTEVLEIVNAGKGCTGNRNSGDCNSGDCNSGNWNSGDCNSGNWNSGDCNSGDCNSGNWNSGDWNSGDWNATSFSGGCFNTEQPKIYMFNKPSNWTLQNWYDSRARYLLNQIDDCTLEYVWLDDMTNEEKAEHPEAKTTGGYLKECTTADNARKWWAGLNAADRNEILSLPNFNAETFKKITGIDINQ